MKIFNLLKHHLEKLGATFFTLISSDCWWTGEPRGARPLLLSFPLLREFGTLRPNTVSIMLNHFQPHLSPANSPGDHKHRWGGRKVLPLQVLMLLFVRPGSGNRSLCWAGWMVIWPSSLGSLNHCSHRVLCSGWVQFNPNFPVALTQTPPANWDLAGCFI